MEGELERGWEEVKLPAFEAMCEVAPVSRNNSVACGPVGGTPEVASAVSNA
jgi:hypothetical protein